MRRGTLILATLAGLSACQGGADKEAEAIATEIPRAVGGQAAPATVVESDYGTPVKDRIATLGLLNKRNNFSQDIVLKSGEARRLGNVIVKLASCERSLPWENPPEVGAFVQVWVEERDQPDQATHWRKVFSGWLFKNSPSVNVVEHPVYDVWVKNCAMQFPGQEETPPVVPGGAQVPVDSAKPAPAPSPALPPRHPPVAVPT